MSSAKVGSCNPPSVSQVNTVLLHAVPIVSLMMNGQERLCLAQISNTLLKGYSYNEIHNRRVALGITCVQCTPVQLEMLRRAGAMPVSSRRCGMITRREAERLVKSFLEDTTPPKLPDDFAFEVEHSCGWGCCGAFVPSRYNSSRAKCIRCRYCDSFFSPNKFIFHYHRNAVDANGATTSVSAVYNHPDAANFNSWRRHLKLVAASVSSDAVLHAWEDVKAMFNGGNRRRVQHLPSHQQHHQLQQHQPHQHQLQHQRPQVSSTMHLPIRSAAADERIVRQHRPHSHAFPRLPLVASIAHHHHQHHHHEQQMQQQFCTTSNSHSVSVGSVPEVDVISRTTAAFNIDNSVVTVANLSDPGEADDVANVNDDNYDYGNTMEDDDVMDRLETSSLSFTQTSTRSTPSTGSSSPKTAQQLPPPPPPPFFHHSPVVPTVYRIPSETEIAPNPSIILPGRTFSEVFSIPPSFMTSLPLQSSFGSASASRTIVRPEPIVASTSKLLPVYHNRMHFPVLISGASVSVEPLNEIENNDFSARHVTPGRRPDVTCPPDDRSSRCDVDESSSHSDASSTCIDVDTVDDTATAADMQASAWSLRVRENGGSQNVEKTESHQSQELDAELTEEAKSRLENMLRLEMEARRAMEMNYNHIKEKLANEADFERRQRKNLERQLQLVKGSLFLELDQERKSRLLLERQLIDAQHTSRYAPTQPYCFPAPSPAWRSLVNNFDAIQRALAAHGKCPNDVSSSRE